MIGALAGPAGTGRTETTKDLGRATIIMVYIFNYSEQMDYKLEISTRVWPRLDHGDDLIEFNLIAADVLSVVAVQAVLVHTAETVRLWYFMDLLLQSRQPVMLVGNAGVGKTSLVRNKLDSLPEIYMNIKLSFNYYTTTSFMLQGTGGQKGDNAATPLLPLCPDGRLSLLCSCHKLVCAQMDLAALLLKTGLKNQHVALLLTDAQKTDDLFFVITMDLMASDPQPLVFVPLTDGLDPILMITDDASVAAWHSQDLPNDRMSIENAAILTTSEHWPLIIDPQQQGIKCIRNRLRSELRVVQLGQKGLELTTQQNYFRIELKRLEHDLLGHLSAARNDFLGFISLVEQLENTRTTAPYIQCKVVEARENETKINEARELYRPTAESASLLFFIVNDLSKINPMYQFPLKTFNLVFTKAMERAEWHEDVRTRVHPLMEAITYSVFLHTSRGLFERDKLTFLSHIAFQNVHLVARWLPSLDMRLEAAAMDSHPHHRVFISVEPPPSHEQHVIPRGILENAIKITNEPPTGMNASLHATPINFSQDFNSMFFSLCFFHACGTEVETGTITTPFCTGDLPISANVLYNYA
ncbi:Dynein heavy chain 11, axonemal Axonemal beta dynein heavy chain 11 Ciliary dynein heavy chain 11 [Channa argus]|uniref:Dynein heavy chain 11, axonemal Axonemal beta dynein heavy chain 11 Ciliary dynein heavy chain 11 n=1 Tax=Channa argus TaxID=215402 RepID=A0A6G1PNG5_CHAAH|nr:Dynein heavy chain 11, axonemal Axonemal beta dynein heavy chain 11 Ciliary dynein heavy chain 11 [Channa argus]